MLGFVIGTVCMFGFLGMAMAGARRRWAYAHGYGPDGYDGCGRGGPWRGHHGWHGHWHGGFDGEEGPRRGRGRWARMGDGPRGEGVARALGEVIKRRLRIDEDQEDIVDHALSDLRTALGELSTAMKDTRGPLAAAFKDDKVDEAALATAFSTHDEAIARARRDVVSALKQIHAVLTPEQRAKATEWLASDATWV